MSRRLTPFDESPRSLIYDELLEYADVNDAIPNQNAFWEQVLVPKRYNDKMSYATYRYYWNQLRFLDKLIVVYPDTYAVRLVRRKLVAVE